MSDEQTLQDFQQCTVRLTAAGSRGTGFFVAAGFILTCHHVVKSAGQQSVQVSWPACKQTYTAEVFKSFETPDLALLQLSSQQEGVPIAKQPWVRLDEAVPKLGEDLYSYGYPSDYNDGDSATFEYEGDSLSQDGSKLYKFKAGQANYGLSGAPLLNPRTGKVCGMVTRSRSPSGDMGGRAIPSTVLLSLLSDVVPLPIWDAPAPLANPFRPLTGRVDDPALFFGRRREIDRVFETLNGGSSVALIGERELGKSSMLWAICQQAAARLQPSRRPVELTLQNLFTEDDFYNELCEQIGIPDCRGRTLDRALRQHRLLLVLDEVERISGFTRQVREQLRGLAEGGQAPVRLVLAASTSLDRLFPDSYQEGQVSPLIGICTEERLQAWDEDTIRAFIADRLAPTPIHFMAMDMDTLIRESQGHPKRLMQLCHQTFARYREQGV